MSKKKKALEAERLMRERTRRKNCFCAGVFVGILLGFCIGYMVKKASSKDAKQLESERAFYKSRLGEIKHALYQIKMHLKGEDAIESLEDVIEEAVEDTIN